MPAAIPLIVAGTAAVGGAAANYFGAKSAANAQKDAAQNATNAQMSMFNTIQQNESPWVQTGSQAQNALAMFYGLPGMSSVQAPNYGSPGGGSITGLPMQLGGRIPDSLRGGIGGGVGGGLIPGRGPIPSPAASQGLPDYNAILSNLPGYQFQLQQGTQATQRNLAASGLLNSGAAQKALAQYGQGLAQSYAGQYTSGLMGLSQLGQAGASGTAAAGMNAANQIGANSIYAGNAQAAGIANSTNALTGGLSGLAGLAGYGSTSSYGGGGMSQQALMDSWMTNP